MATKLHESFLQLVRLGVGTSRDAIISEDVNWTLLKALADSQGLSAIVLDGIDKCHSETTDLPVQLKLEWIGEVLQNYEQRYKQYEVAISNLVGWYNKYSFKMMVLKGYACAINWPKPEHRPCGDVDIWLFGKQREVDALLAKEKEIKVDTSHHHHTVFEWQGFTVENHYDFVNIYAHKSSRGLEKVFKELGQDDSHYVDICGEKIYLPSPNLHALFLLRHMMSHFAAAEITLRQVLDWAFFVKKLTAEIDWEWLTDILEKYHMIDFYNCINAICVEDLGFEVSLFPSVQFDPSLKDRVLNDILEPAYTAEEPRGLINKFVYKYRRWQGNAWKQEMCYDESRLSAFWLGVRTKLFKPFLLW